MQKLIFLVILIFVILQPSAAQENAPAVILLERENTDNPNTVHHFYVVDMQGNIQPFNMAETDQPAPVPLPAHREILAEVSPRYGPIALDVSGLDIVENRLYSMSGENDPYVNLYAVMNGELHQLTDVVSLFPQAKPPILSASAEFLSVRSGAFLYRARLRDAAGQDFNALYLYDFESHQKMPFFGKNPVWSPEGESLAGSRLSESQPPIYELWTVNIKTGEARFIANGCNPQYSPDGLWLAYDLHDNSQWQGYTDCFASGQVEAVNLQTGEKVLLSAGLEKFVTLVGWVNHNSAGQ